MTDDMRALPRDLDAERIVLGCMMLSPEAIGDAQAILTAADLYDPRHERVWAALCRLDARRDPTGPVAVVADLLDTGELTQVGGPAYVHDLLAAAPTAATVGWYARRVAGLAAKRRLVEVGARIAELGYDPAVDAEVAAGRAQEAVHTATTSGRAAGGGRFGDLVGPALEAIDAAGRLKTRGLSTGLRKLDELTGGLRPGQLVITAGRPGMGKSVLGVDLARQAAFRDGRSALLISLEMSHQEIIERILSAETSISLERITSGQLTDRDWTTLARASAELSTAPLTIDDTPDLTLAGIQTRARRHAQRHDLDLLVIDYLQLVTATGRESRQQEVSEISRGLKLLAKQLGCPVVAICQLNRGPEQRADKRPQLADLRESGSLEQDADLVVLLHRDDYYDRQHPRRGRIDLIVAKNRHGAQETVTAAAQLWYSRIACMDGGPQ